MPKKLSVVGRQIVQTKGQVLFQRIREVELPGTAERRIRFLAPSSTHGVVLSFPCIFSDVLGFVQSAITQSPDSRRGCALCPMSLLGCAGVRSAII